MSYATENSCRTRADQGAGELRELPGPHERPADGDADLDIRRVRARESRLLTEMERAASEAELSRVSGPHPHPRADVTAPLPGELELSCPNPAAARRAMTQQRSA